MIWILYLVATNSVQQQKLYAEVEDALGSNEWMTPEMLNCMPYLKACVKEAMRYAVQCRGNGARYMVKCFMILIVQICYFRLYPTTPMMNRILSKDAEAFGYLIPEGVGVTLLRAHTGCEIHSNIILHVATIQ